MRAWVNMSEKQLGELAEQRDQLDQAIDELNALRETTLKQLG